MNIFDIIILCCFLPAVFKGVKDGFIKQIVAIAVIYFGITLSLRFADAVSGVLAAKLSLQGQWLKILSFVIIFAVVALVLSMLGNAISKIIKVTLLGWLDKVLGVCFALFLSGIIISVILYLFNSLNELTGIISKEKFETSVFYEPLLNFANNLFPYLKEFFN